MIYWHYIITIVCKWLKQLFIAQAFPDTNVNAIDYQGRTALQMAVRNQNDDMIDYLITIPAMRMGDTLLYAVREGKPDIVEKLLQWQTQ